MRNEPFETRAASRRLPPWYRRWRTLASLIAALVILLVMMYGGLFGRTDDGGVEWSHVAVYLCGVVVVAMQADRLFHRRQQARMHSRQS